MSSATSSEAGGSTEILILGAGWTSKWLLPLLHHEGIPHAATTTDGRDGTIPFRFDPDSRDTTPFEALPLAKTIMITFPLKGTGPSATLVKMYKAAHGLDGRSSRSSSPRFIQLGVTSIWTAQTWQNESSPYDTSNPRAMAEDELMSLADGTPAAVLSLAGLYGGKRQPRDWVRRVIRSKDDLRNKGALHVIHGEDVARAVVALHGNFTPGKRWLLCDMHVYDWWDLVQDWALIKVREAAAAAAAAAAKSKAGSSSKDGPGEEGKEEAEEQDGIDVVKVKISAEELEKQEEMLNWVGELMVEEGVKALPRSSSSVGRALDGRAFWKTMGIWPTQGRIR